MSRRKNDTRESRRGVPDTQDGSLTSTSVSISKQSTIIPDNNLSKPLTLANDTQAQLKVYELYITRLTKEGEWYWARFNIFLGINTAAFAAVGFFLRDDFRRLGETPLGVSCAVAIVAFAGFVLSSAWKAVNIDGTHWQAFMIAKLAEIEIMLSQGHVDLFLKIQAEYESRLDKDVVNVAVRVARFFQVMWFGITCLAGAYALFATFKRVVPNIAHWVSS